MCPKLDDAPTLPAELLVVWNDFLALGSCRPVGFGPASIPVNAMLEFLERSVVPRDEWEDRLSLWQELDSIVLKHVADKLPKTDEDGKGVGRG